MLFSGIIVGAALFSCFWGILEMNHQKKRVVKGWFPEKPEHHEYDETLKRRIKK